ncbi:tannase/feruloyl esterase family alpha/beta hydrolase [Novosphingobium sp. PP1Y]|uniref:tannase/feruloyl esterase family alpha/beta hydrolase n=1 Tax=Novosphingobium sp. PP1Y TaxID=702113 RepID=UPI00020EEAC9|nr:tannase/feruloyl esterase family alpha/beta hydrolase [Novosphingobium sp. PP1Y]CCA92157.1 feruloyl esterase [Novosphingobium sp. PP1Y]
MTYRNVIASASLAALVVGCAGVAPTAPDADRSLGSLSNQCNALGAQLMAGAPVDGLVVVTSDWEEAATVGGTGPDAQTPLPPHCLVEGYYGEHEGLVGGPYRTGFRMRLPLDWNGRFLFEGGGGSNGVIRDATGRNGVGNTPALERGYAVIAQDSGHDNDRNNVPADGGQMVFGHDPQARADYGHASLKLTYDLGQYIVTTFYGRKSETNLFWGCSKGGQEGMAFAQRYPDAFDGIVAMAPGMSLPRAAVAEAWDTQALAGILSARGEKPTVEGLRTLFSSAQSDLVSSATLAACDGLDGAKDGIVAAVGQCTTARVEPELRARQCAAQGDTGCLDKAQVDALITIMDGPHDSSGKALYSQWAWDGGVGSPGWQVWKTGLVDGPPSLNVVLGGNALASAFTTLPTPIQPDPEQLLAWQLGFDFDKDAPAIYAVVPPYTTSAWQDVGMRSTDLSAFRAHGGKLIVPHGGGDPVFSVLDTIDWWNGVNAANGGKADGFVRVFPVPGMNHCGGGPATDRFDSLAALESWVIDGVAPASIPATAGDDTPWPGRKMPLCPYPQIALANGAGDYRCGLPQP